MLFTVGSILLLAIEEGKQWITFFDMSPEFVKHKRMSVILTWIQQVYNAIICVAAIAFIPVHPFRHNLCFVFTLCLYF